MRVLDPHDGDLGLSAWVDCADCLHDNRRPGWIPPQHPGWFAIRAGDRHWIDRERHQHLHADCGLALVDRGEAEIRDVTTAVREKQRMAKAELATMVSSPDKIIVVKS